MHNVALGAGQAGVFHTRSSSLRTRVKDVLARAATAAKLVPGQVCRPADITRRTEHAHQRCMGAGMARSRWGRAAHPGEREGCVGW
jgi:hypothetical protein